MHNEATIFGSGSGAVIRPAAAGYDGDQWLLSPVVPRPLNMLLAMGKMSKIQDLTVGCFIKTISYSIYQVMINVFFLIFSGDFHTQDYPHPIKPGMKKRCMQTRLNQLNKEKASP